MPDHAEIVRLARAAYPEPTGTPVDVRFEEPLWLVRGEKRVVRDGDRESEYIVARDYRMSYALEGESARREVTVPAGMLTDLASVPWMGRWFVGRVGPHLEAAIVHDWLFVAWQELEPADDATQRARFDFANALMDAAMAAAGMDVVRRFVVRAAVSSFVGRWVFDAPNPEPRYVDVPADAPQRVAERGGDDAAPEPEVA